MAKWIGGTVNGRPFRESSDAYSRTGIPCGNPKRYQSHEVVRMETGVRSRPKPIDGPLENIETEGQKQLQSMLQKQIDKSATIQQQLGQKREFSEGVRYQFSTDELSGIQSLKEYQALGDVDYYIETMKGYGLTHEEILYKLQAEQDSAGGKKSRLGNPDYHDAKLKEIETKIANKKEALSKEDTFSNMKQLSRHEMDLENAIAKGNSKNRFLHKTLVTKRENKRSTDPNDPLNCIPEILESWSKKSTNQSQCLSRRKKKKGFLTECNLECCVPKDVCLKCKSNQSEAEKHESEAAEFENEADDSVSNSSDSTQCTCKNNLIVQTCSEKPDGYISKVEVKSKGKESIEKKPPSKSTSFSVVRSANNIPVTMETDNCENIRLINYVEGIPEDSIRKYKLSLEEVKKIPRFENYTPGEPSNVLFVKNLSNKVTEEDLASLFIQFQTDDHNKLVFKLLNGRMKGQAFVTFNSTEAAMKALELVNGYEFKGKPVIIQYSRK